MTARGNHAHQGGIFPIQYSSITPPEKAIIPVRTVLVSLSCKFLTLRRLRIAYPGDVISTSGFRPMEPLIKSMRHSAGLCSPVSKAQLAGKGLGRTRIVLGKRRNAT